VARTVTVDTRTMSDDRSRAPRTAARTGSAAAEDGAGTAAAAKLMIAALCVGDLGFFYWVFRLFMPGVFTNAIAPGTAAGVALMGVCTVFGGVGYTVYVLARGLRRRLGRYSWQPLRAQVTHGSAGTGPVAIQAADGSLVESGWARRFARHSAWPEGPRQVEVCGPASGSLVPVRMPGDSGTLLLARVRHGAETGRLGSDPLPADGVPCSDLPGFANLTTTSLTPVPTAVADVARPNPGALSGALTADEVLNQKFQATKFRDGYDQDEVDDFLDAVAATLRAHEHGETATAKGAPLLKARDVRAAIMKPVKYREGYDPRAVDALLDRVAATLARYE